MKDGDPLPPQARRAEREFSTILHRLEDGETFAIDELCHSHPDLAPQLRERYREWTVLKERAPADSPSKARVGDSSSAGWKDFLDRLKSRGPAWTRYEFQGVVGEGGMGVVHRVLDTDTRRALALKVLRDPDSHHPHTHPTSGDSPTREEKLLGRFLEEARVTAQLDHPNVVPVHELGVDAEGRAYFTMKLVKGDDLRVVFAAVAKERDGWSLPRAIEVFLKICDAVGYAHAKGVIHRDLKPANVMVGKYGEVYVMDWGLARVLADPERRDLRVKSREPKPANDASSDLSASDSPVVTMDGDVVGTPSYMPPEQAEFDASKIGPWSDVYSLGSMLYELLAGFPPYQDGVARRSAYEVLALVNCGPPPSLAIVAPQADPELVAICQKAMQRDPRQRYETMIDLGNDLRAWIEHRVVSVYESGLLAESKKWVRRNRTLAATIVLALVFITVLIAVSVKRIAEEKNLALGNAERARENEAIAELRRQEAELERRRVEWVLDAVRLDDLKKRWHLTWPAEPRNAAAIRAWLEDARTFLKKREEYSALPVAGDAPTADWWRDQSKRLLGELVALERVEPWEPTIASMTERLRLAESIEERSLTSPDAQAAWLRARAEIRESPRYGGLDLAPQLGLLPLGFDAESGLAEFAFLPSGEAPRRDPKTGTLERNAESAIVFVLVPAGSFSMGAQRDYAELPNFDPQAELAEGPVTPLSLDAFFLGKHEITQAQWRRFTGKSPSRWQTTRPFPSNEPIDDRHPVEQVSHVDCQTALERIGFETMLPTEAQWEYAARADTSTPWGVPERADLPRYANLADATYRARSGIDSAPADIDLDDGFACHAPVGSLRPNAWGFHDMIGNVREWTRDAFSSYEVAAAPRDGERAGPFQDDHVYRGGCFDGLTVHSRCAHRDYKPATFAADYIGVRFARRVSTDS